MSGVPVPRSYNYKLGDPPAEKPKGVHSVRKTLADGSIVFYDYAWKSGPPLVGPRGSAEYMAFYREAISRRHEVEKLNRPKTIRDLIHRYKGSTDFERLRPKTKRDRFRHFDVIEEEFGDMPLTVMVDRRTRGEFKEWREAIALGTKPPPSRQAIARAEKTGKPIRKRKGSKAEADKHWSTLRRLLNWALDLTYIDANPCDRGGKLYEGNRRELIWTEDRESRFFYGDNEHGYTRAPEPHQEAYVVAVWTGQREWDLVDLRLSNYDGTYLTLQQHKRPGPGKQGKRVRIKVAKPLKALLDEIEDHLGVRGASQEVRHQYHVLRNSRGQPWANTETFSASFHRAAKAAGVPDRTFHDLRGTAVVRFARADATIPQIAAITGHSIGDIRSILEEHYLYLDETLGDMAIEKREREANYPSDLVRDALPTDSQLTNLVHHPFKQGQKTPSVISGLKGARTRKR